jgi:FlaA1/EpsC-like NDP-sugar epimerase
MSYYSNKKILVIGGTGTIGTALVKEMLKENPKVIRVLSRDEYKQFVMESEMENEEKSKMRFLIGDVRDYDRVERAMHDVDIVFNLAAMKHVPACEYNPDEAIKTNVNGMQNVIKAAIENKVEAVVFTSSDKAINPTNSYGATKMLAEKLVQAANYSKGPVNTKFVAVRFGNVMGSRGSVIPLFKKQILEQKRITVTDDSMNRFMMTLSDAVKLTMKACEIGSGGEVFVLKMPVIKLKDLAQVIIEESCKKYNINQSEIHYEKIGIRAGERMYEELMTKEEAEYAYDLGDMYTIIPSTFAKGAYESIYGKYKHAEIIIYASYSQKPIAKEDLRQLIISENLI